MRVRSAHRISSISNTAGSVSISTVTLIVPGAQLRAPSRCGRARRSTAPLRGGSAASADRNTGRDRACRAARALWKAKRPRSNSAPDIGSPSIDEMFLRQMPAARTHHQHGGVRLHVVVLALRRGELDRAGDRVAQVALAVEQAFERRRRRILEIGHEHLRAGVQRVDDHLAIDRPGDLDAAVLQCGGNRARRCHSESRIVAVSVRKSGSSPASKRACRSARARQQRQTTPVEPMMQIGQERARRVGQRISRSADAGGRLAAAAAGDSKRPWQTIPGRGSED